MQHILLNHNFGVKVSGELRAQAGRVSKGGKEAAERRLEWLRGLCERLRGEGEGEGAAAGGDEAALEAWAARAVGELAGALRDKEAQHAQQRQSLVGYYEQLLNDVNSRVKVSALGHGRGHRVGRVLERVEQA